MTVDIGDDYRISTTITVDGTPIDPASVSLAITDPAGVTTNPAPDNTGVGLYGYTLNVDQAGRWRYRWVTTVPAGVHSGSVIVCENAPPRLDPLATTEDMEATLGRSLTDAERAQAPALLRSASARVRAFCGNRKLTRVDNDIVTLRPVGHILTLPDYPVHSVASVAVLDNRGQPTTIDSWAWDGSSQIEVGRGWWWHDTIGSAPANSYQVTYTHGYDIVPDVLVDVSAGAALRVLTSPTSREGSVGVTIGQFTEQFQQGMGAPGLATKLNAADRQDLKDAGFKPMAATIQLSA